MCIPSYLDLNTHLKTTVFGCHRSIQFADGRAVVALPYIASFGD